MKLQRAFLAAGLLLLLLTLPVSADPSSPAPPPIDQEVAIASQVFLPLVSYQLSCPAPALISPANDAQLETLKPRFSYVTSTATDGRATTTIATDAALTAVVAEYSSSPGNVSFTIFSNLEPATDYYWRAGITCGGVDFVSAIWHFRTGSGGTILPAPNLLAPDDGSTGVGPELDLAWTAVPGATGYWVHIHRVGHYTTLYARPEPQMRLYGLPANAPYQWYVQAYNDYAYGEESPRRQFTTGTYTAANLDLPANQTSSGDTCRWPGSARPSG